jgi:hypothetical protein
MSVPNPATTEWVPLQGTRLDGMTYWGTYEASRTYNDGDCVIASNGILYMCVKDGTVGSAPPTWPGRAGPQGAKGDTGAQGIQGVGVPMPVVDGKWIKGSGGAAIWADIAIADLPQLPATKVTGLVTADTGWTAMSLYAGVTNYGSGYPVGRFRKDASNTVHLSGLLMTPAGWTAQPFTTLPVGYRPSSTLHVPCVASAVFSYIHINPSGTLQINAPAQYWVSLDHITYIAEQ